ncbi:hypothetical protein ABZO31_21440 [Streptomyces sp. HUAS MG47]|uniref:hypothetical protein n=1 Tax=Streptomyces solicamelliae TaxID=3231716 RepID=UPI003877C863
MTTDYEFHTVHRPAPDVMTAGLAAAVGVAPDRVDVGHHDADPDGRDWGADVLCTYDFLDGDLTLSWSIYVTDAVPDPPDEETAASRLAAAIGATVFCEALDVGLPSACWAMSPDGTRTRARVYDPEEPDLLMTVDAVEDPVADLPGIRVRCLPEAYAAERVPTPVTDAFEAAIALDGTASTQNSPTRLACWLLYCWERLVRRLEADWSPSDRYPGESYLDDLRSRDELSSRLATLPPDLATQLAAAVAELDALFQSHTVVDEGEFLGRLTGPGTEIGTRDWWWQRRPCRVPYGLDIA